MSVDTATVVAIEVVGVGIPELGALACRAPVAATTAPTRGATPILMVVLVGTSLASPWFLSANRSAGTGLKVAVRMTAGGNSGGMKFDDEVASRGVISDATIRSPTVWLLLWRRFTSTTEVGSGVVESLFLFLSLLLW